MLKFILCALLSVNAYSVTSWNKTLNLTSFNLGLAHNFVPYAQERVPALVKALQQHDSDVLCLQEVWLQEDRQALIDGLKSKFPWYISTPINQKLSAHAPTCPIGDIFGKKKFGRCMMSKCQGKEKDEFVSCVINTCREPLDQLKHDNPECATALMAQVDKSPLGGLMAVFNPFKPAGLFAYGGSNGIMLFSKHPLINSKTIGMGVDSTLNRRDVLYAELAIRGKNHRLFCTHLTANLTFTAPYSGKYLNWEEENGVQVRKLLDWSSDSPTSPTYVMGDFNCSKPHQQAEVQGDFAANCQKFWDAGLKDPVYSINPQCTFCHANLLNADNKEGNLQLDHIFIKNAVPKKVDVAFREQITVQVKKKGEVTTQLSDHYGVSVHVDISQ